MVGLIEGREDVLNRGMVVADQPSLHASLCAVTEDVQPRAAQPLQRGEQAEGGHHPGAIFALLELTGGSVALGEQGWRKVEGEPVVAFELRGELLQEFAVAVEASNLVLVLV